MFASAESYVKLAKFVASGLPLKALYDEFHRVIDDAMVLSRICPFIAETMERMELYSRLS